MPSAVAGPPLEEHLAQNTLWPEVFKLYGHANHVFSMAADPQGTYLASACKVLPLPGLLWIDSLIMKIKTIKQPNNCEFLCVVAMGDMNAFT